jgi:protein-ribulosamine 3-kinase
VTPETLETIAATIGAARNIRFTARNYTPVSGGDINNSFLLADGDHCFFVKSNRPEHKDMLEREKTSLQVLAKTGAIPVPAPVASGTTADAAFLVLEHHAMQNHGDDRKLAQGLVNLHRQTSPTGQYGWEEDNFIGTSPQSNRWHDNWCEFWLTERLRPQLAMAYSNGYDTLQPSAERLETRLPHILGDHQPQPSLLHGDLWGGNAAFLDSGDPILYDPASYYGDRETDLALTELFGGFSAAFYDEYDKLWPLDSGYQARKKLYNLYHLLNHLNLFGTGYLDQCRNVMEQLVGVG